MFGTLRTLRTLMAGANARAEERVREVYSIELIDQKIRESQAALTAAKITLASLIQRERAESRSVEALKKRVADLSVRVAEALDKQRNDLANEGAEAIATLENERIIREQTVERLTIRIERLRNSVELTHRRIIDLQQGAIAAKAVRHEQMVNGRISRTAQATTPIREAEQLIAQVLGRDDPLEQGEILDDIDRSLDRTDVADRMAAAGIGMATKVTAADVLARLKS
ncbi:MAG: PspA/IM30 family protein [Deltaproteobacteria bacterium]